MTEIDRRQFLAATSGLAAVSLFPEVLPAAPRLQEPLKLGLVGAGRQGRAILTELAKIAGVKVAAVCDTDPQRLAGGKSKAGDAEGFEDHRALLDKAKDLAGVIIATPTHLHKQVALDAVAAGRHVYCEAPLAHTLDDARAIAKAASGVKTVFAVGHEGRSNPVYGLARSFFRTDAFKDMLSMRAQFAQKTTWRLASNDPAREKVLNWRLDKDLSTGICGEIGSHQFDVVHWYRNKHPVSVRGFGSVRANIDGREVPDTVLAEFAFDDGARFVYNATLGSSYEGRYEVLYGTNATFRLAWTHAWMFKESDAPTQGWEVYANRQQILNDVGITLIADATQLASQGKLKEGVGLPETPLYYALSDFVRSIAEKTPVACTAEEGFRSTAVAILANQAILKGTEVSIDAATLKIV